ncbi:MAG: LegC family aminotransferase [Bacteroidales bacterium]|nr:LegC family aminotransferase [Bacteroidales bacterium]
MEDFDKIIHFIRNLYNKPQGLIPLHAPVFKGKEKEYLMECIDTTFVSSVGIFVDRFEDMVAEYTGAKKAVVCVNGTNALHLALMLVGVERNTEVITQTMTFIATANAIAYCGAQPVFLDVDKDTIGLSPNALKNWLYENVKVKATASNRNISSIALPFNKKTGRLISACVPMHTFGHPVLINEIVEICSQYNIPVIEDAAESLGSFYKGLHTGTIGKIGVLSFNGNKILTTGGGGMLLFKDEELGKKAKHLTTQAKTAHPWEFIHDQIGYNYRLPNVNAAIGCAQLEYFDKTLANKRETASYYKAFFANTNIDFFMEPKDCKSNYWLNTIILKDKETRDQFLDYTNKRGVMTRPAWHPMHKLKMFRKCQTDGLENSQWFEERIVNIPSSVRL